MGKFMLPEERMRKNTIQIIKVFFAVLVLLLLLMVAASAIPNRWLEANQSEAIGILKQEGLLPQYFFGSLSAQQDNYSDLVIIVQTLNGEHDNALTAAMHPTYARYWHGYSVVLRPLLCVFTLYQIRYGMMLLFFLLFGAAAILIARRIDIPTAAAFLAANAMAYLLVAATSLQFFPVFLIAYLAVIVQLLHPDAVRKNHLVFFLIIGMLTSFIDLLTAPLLTLGLPLIVYLLADNEEARFTGRLKTIAASSVLWGIGYGATWASKWLIGSVILRQNVLQNASEAMSFRLNGNEEYAGGLLSDRLGAISVNAETMFLSAGKRMAVLLALVLAVLLIIALLRRTASRQRRLQALAVLLVGTFPYIWYFVLSNHSLIHTFFTYRAQVVSIFALLAFLGRMTAPHGEKKKQELSHG